MRRAVRKRDGKGTYAPTGQLPGALAWALVGAALLFVAVVRIRLLNVPLERDEGEFAYVGQLILQGIAPYKLAYNMKLPGIYAAYALVMAVFGQSIVGIHLGLLLVNAGAIVLVFLLGRRLFGPLTGVIACASYAVLSTGRPGLVMAAHATHFVVLFALGGILTLLKALDKDRPATFFWSGLLLGLAFTMKQPGAFFIVFALFYLVWTRLRVQPIRWGGLAARSGALIGGAAIPFALSCFILWRAGVFERFWFWAFRYGHEYATMLSLNVGVQALRAEAPRAIGVNWPLWSLGALGLAALIIDKALRPRAVFMAALLVLSCCAVSVGMYFRQHYFVMMLPAVALLCGCAVSAAYRLIRGTRKLRRLALVPALILLAALAYPVWKQRDFYFRASPTEVARMFYGMNPFPESIEVARYIREHASKADRIAVLGSEPQIYFYTRLHSATGYIYMYPLMEKQKYALQMQEEMIGEIEHVRPRYIVLVGTPDSISWFWMPYSQTRIIKWYPGYIGQHYEIVGLADSVAPDYTVYYWGRDAASEEPTSGEFIAVFERKGR